MIRTCFRPSDDHAKFPFNIPANAYAVVELRRLAALLKTLGDTTLNPKASTLASVRFRMRRRDYPVVPVPHGVCRCARLGFAVLTLVVVCSKWMRASGHTGL